MSSADKRILLILATIWGGSFVFIRIAAPVFGPVIMVELRVAIAAASLIVYAKISGADLGLKRWWPHYLFLGGVNSAAPFLLVSAAEIRISASMAVLLNATSPLFSALISAAVFGDALTWRKISGIAISISGVAALVGLSPLKHDLGTMLSVAASLSAAFVYGIAGAFIRIKMQSAPAIGMATGSHLGAAVIIAPFAMNTHIAHYPTAAAITCLLALAFLCTTAAYIMYFKLILSAGATNALSVTFLTPVFGLVWGAVLIHDTITPLKLAACAAVLSGTALLLHPGRRPRPADAALD